MLARDRLVGVDRRAVFDLFAGERDLDDPATTR
jgi:hypothetical protein